MTWRWKRWLGAALLILLINGMLLVLNRQVFLESFVRLEGRQASEHARYAVSVYRDTLAVLDRTARDWANWDDAYAFMEDRNPAFLQSNLAQDTLAILNLNVILFFDQQGGLVAGSGYDLDKEMQAPVPGGLLQMFGPEGDMRTRLDAGQVVKGLVSLPEGVLMFACEPILTGARKGPARGRLLMGRFLDQTALNDLANKAHLPLEFSRLNSGPDWPRWPQTAQEDITVFSRLVDGSRIRFRILLRDVFGAPATVIGISFPRAIYAQGVKTIFYFHVGMLLASLLGGGAFLWVWGRLSGSREKQRESEDLFRHLFQFSPDAFFLCDAQGRLLDVNRQTCSLLGGARQDLLGMRWAELTELSFDDLLNQGLGSQIAGPLPIETTFKGKNGDVFPCDIRVSRFELQGRVLVFVLVRDITERKLSGDILLEQKNRLNYLAYHDVLTGLPNRLHAIELLQVYISRAKQRDSTVAVLLFDIDRFKNINESLGHVVGDELLVEIALRIKGTLRDSDEVARFGGDEFLVLIELSREHEGGGAIAVAEKILEEVAHPLRVGEQQFYLTGSIGISQFPKHGKDVQGLLKAADSAMHFAKEQGRNTFRVFIPALNVDVEERLYLERDLRQALKQGQFVLYFQPQFKLVDGEIECLEALIRWNHPQRGMVGPDEFIPLAEDTGLIVPIGEWVMQEACRLMKEWRRKGIRPLRVAVNISARQFRQSGFVEMVFRTLKQFDIAAEWLELEFTERIVIQGAEHASNMLKLLRQSGLGLAIDDFGLGYSSLIYLKKFPFSKMKMDRAFIKNLVRDVRDKAIAAAIVAMGETLGMEVVAEGVEAREQLDALRELGCPSGQGYYLALPMDPQATEEYLKVQLGDNALPAKAFRT